jgi:hypothetical protein
MTFFLSAIKDIRHPEERLKGASRRTQNADAATFSGFITASFAGMTVEEVLSAA